MSLPVAATSLEVPQSGSQAEEKKKGYILYEAEPGLTIRLRHNLDPDMDPQKFKRTISNRVSAQKSRWKKLQYVDALEKRSVELQSLIRVMRSQLEIATYHKRYLENEQMQLKDHISARLQQSIISDGVTEMYKAEIERLKNLMPPLTYQSYLG